MPPKGRFALKKDRDKRAEEDVAPKERVLPRRERVVDLPDAICVLIENYFTIAECEKYMAVMTHEIDWRKQLIAVGRRDGDPEAIVAEPRLTLFMSDPGICYEYSGRENIGEGWHPTVLELKARAEKAVQDQGQPAVVFNSVQLNRYNGPRHTLGMHADDEPDLLRGAPIVSISFGCTRDFRIQRRDKPSSEQTIELADGSLLLMGGAMQTHYLHGVPPGGQTGLRFNLTFRVCVPREAKMAAGSVQPRTSRFNRGAPRQPEDTAAAEQFVEENRLDERAAGALLGAPPDVQQLVISRGSLREARNPSAALLTRLKECRAAAGSAASRPTSASSLSNPERPSNLR